MTGSQGGSTKKIMHLGSNFFIKTWSDQSEGYKTSAVYYSTLYLLSSMTLSSMHHLGHGSYAGCPVIDSEEVD